MNIAQVIHGERSVTPVMVAFFSCVDCVFLYKKEKFQEPNGHISC